MRLNADFALPVVIRPGDAPWVASPLAGVPLAAVDRWHHAFNGEAGIAQEGRAAVFAVSGPVNPSTGIARTHLQQCPANP